MKTVTELRGELHELTAKRTAAIAKLNAAFDKKALELNRRIEVLDPPFHCVVCGGKYQHRDYCRTLRTETVKPAPKPAPKPRATRPPVVDPDWSPEDVAHFRELASKGRKGVKNGRR